MPSLTLQALNDHVGNLIRFNTRVYWQERPDGTNGWDELPGKMAFLVDAMIDPSKRKDADPALQNFLIGGAVEGFITQAPGGDHFFVLVMMNEKPQWVWVADGSTIELIKENQH